MEPTGIYTQFALWSRSFYVPGDQGREHPLLARSGGAVGTGRASPGAVTALEDGEIVRIDVAVLIEVHQERFSRFRRRRASDRAEKGVAKHDSVAARGNTGDERARTLA